MPPSGSKLLEKGVKSAKPLRDGRVHWVGPQGDRGRQAYVGCSVYCLDPSTAFRVRSLLVGAFVPSSNALLMPLL